MSSPSNNTGVYHNNGLLPYQKFIYALRAPESKRQYPRRLKVFLDYIDIFASTIEEKSDLFYDLIEEKGRNWLESELMRFFTYQNQRAENKEISTQTIKNYLKPVKLFCEMNGIIVNWKMISKGIKRGDKCSNDRPPSNVEITKLLEYPDRRIRPIVLIMISSGMRAGSWDYLKWGDITPALHNNSVIVAKIRLFNTKTNKFYFSFITPEAYKAVKDWMDFRASFGEKINSDSWIMRNLWQIKSQRYGNYLGLAKNPIKFSVDGIRMLINDAWKIQGVREKNNNGRKYAFKNMHGFRKFFQSQCQKVMKSINVSILMSHDTGIVQHYYRPTEQDLLDDYLNAVTLLMIDQDEIKLNEQIQELEQRNQTNEYIIKGKLQEKDEEISLLKEKDKINGESISNLSDQLVMITERLNQLEKST